MSPGRGVEESRGTGESMGGVPVHRGLSGEGSRCTGAPLSPPVPPGPMVYAVCYCPEEKLPELEALGVAGGRYRRSRGYRGWVWGPGGPERGAQTPGVRGQGALGGSWV